MICIKCGKHIKHPKNETRDTKTCYRCRAKAGTQLFIHRERGLKL